MLTTSSGSTASNPSRLECLGPRTPHRRVHPDTAPGRGVDAASSNLFQAAMRLPKRRACARKLKRHKYKSRAPFTRLVMRPHRTSPDDLLALCANCCSLLNFSKVGLKFQPRCLL